jgi:hypothetical protein
MSINSSSPPPDALDILSRGLGQIRTAPGGEAVAFAAKLTSGHEPHWSDGLPHGAYNLGLDAISPTAALDTAARLVGWRFLLGQPSEHPAVAAEVASVGGAHEFAGLNRGPFVGQTLAAMQMAEAAPELRDGDFEPRFLRVPALYVVALWLKERATGKDIVIPLDPAPPELTTGRQYTGAEFMTELAAMKSRATAPSALEP